MNKPEKILQQVKDDYNKIAEHFSQTRYAPWSEFELFKQYIKTGQKVLDLGCGNGRLFFSYLKDFKVEYYGVDNSEKLIEIARKRIFNFQFSIFNKFSMPNFQIGEMTELPYQDNQFDVIICIATFHHLPTKNLRLKTLSEVYRILTPGGYLLMTNWHLWHKPYLKHFFNQFSQKLSLKDFFVPWKSPDGQIQCQRYYHAFSKSELRILFRKAGFKIEKIFFHQDPNRKIYGRGVNVVAIAKKI
jgi:ubiquinone/menaquinone biosynthesis C-methylase UbiE